MAKEEIILVGGGGHCQSVIDVIETTKQYRIAGIIDSADLVGKTILSYPVIGSDNDIEAISKEYSNFFVTIGQIKSAAKRKQLFSLLKKFKVTTPIIISPSSHVSKHSSIGEGSIIMHHAVINAGAVIGSNCIINTKAIIEHGVYIGNHCHISTAAVINGDCQINDGTFVGSNSTVVQGVIVENNNVIAAGAVLVNNTEIGGVYAGIPAQFKKTII